MVRCTSGRDASDSFKTASSPKRTECWRSMGIESHKTDSIASHDPGHYAELHQPNAIGKPHTRRPAHKNVVQQINTPSRRPVSQSTAGGGAQLADTRTRVDVDMGKQTVRLGVFGVIAHAHARCRSGIEVIARRAECGCGFERDPVQPARCEHCVLNASNRM